MVDKLPSVTLLVGYPQGKVTFETLTKREALYAWEGVHSDGSVLKRVDSTWRYFV